MGCEEVQGSLGLGSGGSAALRDWFYFAVLVIITQPFGHLMGSRPSPRGLGSLRSREELAEALWQVKCGRQTLGWEESKLGTQKFSGKNVSAHPRGRLCHSPAFRPAHDGAKLSTTLSAEGPWAAADWLARKLQPQVPGEAGQSAVQDCFYSGALGPRRVLSKSSKAASGSCYYLPWRARKGA